MAEVRVLVTGGSGFIGSALVARLAAEPGFLPVASVRGGKSLSTLGVEAVDVGNVGATTDWAAALRGVDAVVHTAAVAHVRNEGSREQLEHLRLTNVEGALNLGRQALAAGVRRFVFVSSISVNGTYEAQQPFDESSHPAPQTAYAASKLDAEVALQALFADTAVELVIIRPPLVYCAHAPGNFKRLLQIVNLGLPLPFAGLSNYRSIVSLENLVDFICCSLIHPAAANQLFLLAEGAPVSTADIIRYLALGMGKPNRLFAFPKSLIAMGCRVLGQARVYSQLFESLAINGDKAKRLLDWQPPVSTEAGLIEAGRAYRQVHGGGPQ